MTGWDEPGYQRLVAARRALTIPGFMTYAEAGLDGPWITPYHLAACSPSGPVLLTYNFLDAPSAIAQRQTLLIDGFLPEMPFNRVLDLALRLSGLRRNDLYVTHAFHLLPATRSAAIPVGAIDQSFDAIARHELGGRKVVALGAVAAGACRRHGIACSAVAHPSARGRSFADRAKDLAAAITAAR